jgi:heme oxygenase
MTLKTDSEKKEKINECILNKSKHIEWLCQNKTEKQLEQLLKRLEKMNEFVDLNQTVSHIELISLWKEEVKSALKNFSDFENFYIILRKMKKNKKITKYERMIADMNHDWFYNRIYDVA